MRLILPMLLAIALTACSVLPDKITAAPPGVFPITNPTIVTDLQSASFNLDSAVSVGALDADDPAPKCVHAVLVKAGIEVLPGTTPAASFEPKKDGVASAGAIVYILAQQAKKAARTARPIDPSCEALVGRIVIDGVSAARRALPRVLSLTGG